MRRRLPPMDNVEAFVVAASSPNFKAAADSMALSEAAFSRRIQSLSDHVGLKLFERRGSVTRLTEAGRRCLSELEPAYIELIRATSAVEQLALQQSRVRLSLSPSMAIGWFVPRLSHFQQAYPHIELSFRSHRDTACLRRGEVDLAVCHVDVDLKGLDAQPLLGVSQTPVASPVIAQTFRNGGRDLESFNLVSVDNSPGRWSVWAQAAGFRLNLDKLLTFDNVFASYEFASQDMGIAMGASATIGPHLESGRLESLGLPAIWQDDIYWLAINRGVKRHSPVDVVRRWLLAEGRSSSNPTTPWRVERRAEPKSAHEPAEAS